MARIGNVVSQTKIRGQRYIPIGGGGVVSTASLISPITTVQGVSTGIDLSQLSSYKVGDNSYDLASAVKDKVDTQYLESVFGSDAVSQVQSALKANANIQAIYDALSSKQKEPKQGYTLKQLANVAPVDKMTRAQKAEFVAKHGPGFDKVIRLLSTATDIPDTPGFYSYQSQGEVDSKTKETNYTVTVYARLEDGSLLQVDKQSKTTPAYWFTSYSGPISATQGKKFIKAVPGQEPPKGYVLKAASFKQWYEGRIGAMPGATTHEQKMGAQKLSKEMGVPYEQALGLVSASGYYDPNAIVKLPGPSGYGVFDPKTGKAIWGKYTPEVASALGKLKPYQKADGSYDWEKIILEGSTPVILAATTTFGIELSLLKGVKDTIQTYPELRVALRNKGWEGYQEKAQEMRRKWEVTLREDYPTLYEVYKSDGYAGMANKITAWENADEILNVAGLKTKDGYLVVQALVSDDPKVVVAIKTLFSDTPEVLIEAEKFIEENYQSQWPEGGIRRAISDKWREVTPWREEKGETFGTYLANLTEKIPEQAFSLSRPITKEDLFPKRSLESAWAYKDRLAQIPESEVAMARASWEARYGKESPEEVAVTKTVNWINDTFLPGITKLRELVHKEVTGAFREKALSLEVLFPKKFTESPSAYRERLRNLTEKEIVTRRSEVEGTLPIAEKPFLSVPEALADMVAVIPGTIAGVGTSSLLQAGKGETKEAIVAPAMLVAGMGEWFVGRPLAFTKDPLYEIPYTTVLLAGEPFKTVFSLAKKAEITLNPRKINATALSLEADIARVVLPKNMDAFSARGLIEAVELAWGGKGKVPPGVKKLLPWEQVVLTAVAKNTDVVFKGKDGKVIGRVTPFQITTPQTAFHATGNISSATLGGMLKDKGYFKVESEGTYSGFWASQQFSQAFIIRGPEGIKNPGGVIIRFSALDLRELPPNILRLKEFEAMKVALSDMARAGKLKPGIYPVFKHYGKPPKFELELFVAPGTKLKAIKPKWYAPETQGTASIKTQSMISYKDPVSGLVIKEGQSLPMLIVATETALKEGLGVPPLKSLYGAKLLTPYVALKKWAPWRIRLRQRVTGEAEVPYVGTPLLSTFKGITLKGESARRRWINDVLLKRVKESPKTERIREVDVTGAFEKNGRLNGDIFDKAGNIIKEDKPYWNKDVGGYVRRRVSAVVVDAKGRLLLVTDHLEPKGYYGLPGGNLKVEHLLPGAEKFTPEVAAYLQVQSEVGFGIRNAVQLPSYLGQMNRHSLPGSYVFLAKAGDRGEIPKIDINWFVRENADLLKDPTISAKVKRKFSQPELSDAFWWDGKSSVSVSPATYDIILRLVQDGKLKDFDISKLSISDKTPKKLLTARDTGYYAQTKIKAKEFKATDLESILKSLPPPKENTIRIVHGGSVEGLGRIQKTGLHFFDGLSDTAVTLAKDVTKGSKDIGVYLTGSKQRGALSIFDIPKELYDKYEGKTKLTKAEKEIMAQEAISAAEKALERGEYVSDTYMDAFERGDVGSLIIGTVPQQYLIGQVIKSGRNYTLRNLVDQYANFVKKEDIIKAAEKDFKANRANEVKLRAEERARKGEDYEIAWLEEMAKDADAYFRDVFNPKSGKAKKWLDQREKYQKLYEEYGQLPYKPTRRGVVLLYPEADLKEGKLKRGTEYKPGGFLEYLLAYPEVSPRYYPLEKEPELEPYPEVRPEKKPYPEVRAAPYKEPKTRPYPEPKTKYPPLYPPEYPPIFPPKYPPPPPTSPPPPVITTLAEAKKAMKDVKGAVAWKQGFMHYVVKEPYATPADVLRFYKVIPPGVQTVKPGPESALRSIQALGGGKVPEKLAIDMGIQDITISKPTVAPGKEGAIEFERDVKQKTTGDISIGKIKRIRGESTEALKKLALGTTLKQLVLEAYDKDKIPEKVVRRMTSEKLSKLTPKQIANELSGAGLSKAKIAEVLRHLPDRERQQVELLLEMGEEIAPTRGTPRAVYQLSKLRRKKQKTKRKVEPEPVLVGL